jgi:hypothetical protein
MKMFRLLSAVVLALALGACATKGTPHKLTASAPGDNAAPSASSW